MNNETMKIIPTRVGGFRADLELLGPPQVVAALIAQIHAFAQAILATIAELKNELSAAYAADHGKWNGAEPENRTPVEVSPWTGALRTAGIAAVVLEACFAAILAALTFNVPIIAAAAVGAGTEDAPAGFENQSLMTVPLFAMKSILDQGAQHRSVLFYSARLRSRRSAEEGSVTNLAGMLLEAI
jgi:hypothetical protein